MQGYNLLSTIANAVPVTALTLRAGMFYLQHQEGSAGATTLSALQSSGAAVVKSIVAR